ncbi:MAG: acyl-CoA dehydrogenase C-terminal domain-containing protein [Myxococcota bacterium]
MTRYRAPKRDIRFVVRELFDFETHYRKLPAYSEVDENLIHTILDEYAAFCEEVVAPLNRSGDEEGCTFSDGEVRAPKGFKEAYRQYAEAGWTSLPWEREHGGQGLPLSLNKLLMEILAASNVAFSLYLSAQPGALETLSVFGSPAQRRTYAPKLVDGTWNATMCLTEPHCGTDLGLLRTKAEPDTDGAFRISGTKVFITGGEHDFNENIVHLVLARIENAPEGTAGISLFVVPKFDVDADGNPGKRNAVSCGSIEHKMGVHGSSTCMMHFEGAKGHLLGEPNRGLHAMFTFINASRISAAMQGVAHAEFGFQKSLAYARDRLQMRAATGPERPEQAADPIIVHPNVRRMLLTQKALAEGNRMMTYDLAMQLDRAAHGPRTDDRRRARQRLDFMTPIAKAFATETGFEAANLALQCFGGHGYIREWGVEQNVRDARVATLYEGTTGVQALDLLGRKVLGTQGKLLAEFIDEIERFCEAHHDSSLMSLFVSRLAELTREWSAVTERVGQRASANPEEIGAASVSYLMYSGYVCLAYYWARAAAVAGRALTDGEEPDFYEAKIATARFYYDHILPRTRACVGVIDAGAESLMALNAESFQF